MGYVLREQTLAFRLAGHNLTRRLPGASLLDAAAACGIQETPTGSAGLAFAARTERATPADLDDALRARRTLVTLWSVRGAPYVVPSADLEVFSAGALPVGVASVRQMLGGWAAALETAGLDPMETLEQMIAAARELLDGRTLGVNDLRDEVFARVTPLSSVTRPSGAHADMPEPLFRALGTTGVVCIVAGRGTDAELARADQWLPPPAEPAEPAEPAGDDVRPRARAELARRFLHCYGPASAQNFAEWSGRSTADSRAALSSLGDELTEVTVDGKPALLLAADLDAFSSPAQPHGARLLPVNDPFLQQRDRATLVPDAASRRRLWQAVRGPGGVLVDGEVSGTWRSRSAGRRLEITIEPFGRLSPSAREEIEAEAQRVALTRNHEVAEVHYTAQ